MSGARSTTARRRSSLFKPDYDGQRGAPVATDREAVNEPAMALLRARLAQAMLTMDSMQGERSSRGSFWPDYLVEFADRVGEKAPNAPRPTPFQPSGSQIDDMLPALALLEGLRREYFELVWDKAVTDFYWKGATWSGLGAAFGRSGQWAKDAYDRAILQAARRAGILAQAREDYAVVCVGAITEGVFFTWIGASANPKQQVWDLKSKSVVGIADAFALWTPGKPIAKRLIDATKALYGDRRKHGAWHRALPFDVEDTLLSEAEKIGSVWRLEYLD